MKKEANGEAEEVEDREEEQKGDEEDREENKEKHRHKARRIDIKLVPIESFYYGMHLSFSSPSPLSPPLPLMTNCSGVMHSTGSDEFNRQLRYILLLPFLVEAGVQVPLSAAFFYILCFYFSSPLSSFLSFFITTYLISF